MLQCIRNYPVSIIIIIIIIKLYDFCLTNVHGSQKNWFKWLWIEPVAWADLKRLVVLTFQSNIVTQMLCCCIWYDMIQYIYVRSKADEIASLI